MTDERDARRRVLRLTSKGRQLVETLAPFWEAEKRATRKLAEEIPELMNAIDGLEDALDQYSLEQRATDEFEVQSRV